MASSPRQKKRNATENINMYIVTPSALLLPVKVAQIAETTKTPDETSEALAQFFIERSVANSTIQPGLTFEHLQIIRNATLAINTNRDSTPIPEITLNRKAGTPDAP